MSYRTHNCGELRLTDAGSRVKLAGWVKRVRDLGSMAFIALRDHYGVTQVIVPSDASEELQAKVKQLKPESIVMIEGTVRSRDKDINPDMPTGEIELLADNLIIDSIVEDLPFPLNDILPSEDLRLKYRFIDLRREKLQANLRLRSRVIYSLRKYLIEEQGFMEIQTPILTVSSPEGARDFVVPCRVHPGRFYALPQAPQQYKQLLMCSGFDKYFQIAPCFRDEDARADRSPGEFYQLDMEMAFPTQDRVFETIEKTFKHLNEELSDLGKRMMEYPFPRITFKDAMEKYGSDKPDIRFGMEMQEVSDIFVNSEFKAFASNATGPNCVKAIVAENTADRSRKFFDKAEAEVKKHGARGLAYLKYKDGEFTGSIRKFLSDAELDQLVKTLNVKEGDSILLCAGERNLVQKAFGKVRVYLANVLELLDKDLLAFCWIVDFPMFEYDEEEEKIDFSHNPFSMPQGGMDALLNKDPLDILAYQYDIVCNGYELSSGAIRNHRPDIMYKAFEIVGYGKEVVDEQFGHMISAFKFGAPPHGGLAPGVDRIVMIYADEPNIREVTAFPMNQKAQDLMMGAPSEITQAQLDELHLQLVVPEKEKA